MISRAAQQYGVNTGSPYYSTADALANSANSPLMTGSQGAAPSNIAPSSNSQSAGLWLLAIFIVLVVLKFASEHERAGMSDPKLLGVNIWNLVIVSFTAILGIAVIKIGVNKWHVPGLTDLVNIV